jgi:hypothetical protein
VSKIKKSEKIKLSAAFSTTSSPPMPKIKKLKKK